MKKIFKVEVDCAVCAQKCEKAIAKIEGVKAVQINFLTQKMILEADDVDALLPTIENAAKKIEPDFEILN